MLKSCKLCSLFVNLTAYSGNSFCILGIILSCFTCICSLHITCRGCRPSQYYATLLHKCRPVFIVPHLRIRALKGSARHEWLWRFYVKQWTKRHDVRWNKTLAHGFCYCVTSLWNHEPLKNLFRRLQTCLTCITVWHNSVIISSWFEVCNMPESRSSALSTLSRSSIASASIKPQVNASLPVLQPTLQHVLPFSRLE